MDVVHKLQEYYKEYYHRDLGIPDWEARISRRLKEEETFGEPAIKILEKCANMEFADKKVLVVGAGTGAELFAFHSRGAEVYGVEPGPKAMEILEEKAKTRSLPVGRIVQGVGERLPMPTEHFDLVYCYTVLEHVADVEECLEEMRRVCKVGGLIFLEFPNYAVPYEPHYKMVVPTFLPRFMIKAYLRLRGRPAGFLDTLNFIKPKRVISHFRSRSVTCMQIFSPFPPEYHNQKHPVTIFRRLFGVEKDIYLLLIKDSAGTPYGNGTRVG